MLESPERDSSRRGDLLWGLFFVVLALLSLDTWAWGRPLRFGPFHLPGWIYYFVALQIVLAGALSLFSTRRRDRDDRDGEA